MAYSKYILIFILLPGLIACSDKNKIKGVTNDPNENLIELSTDQLESIGLEIDDLKKKRISDGISVNGFLDTPPQFNATVGSILEGRILQIRYLPGHYVKKGQWVVKIESKEFLLLQKNYIKVSSELEYLENEYDRQKKLNENNVNALKTFLQAERDLISKKAELNTIKLQLELAGIKAEEIVPEEFTSILTIRAPINGYISAIYTKKGKNIRSEDDIFRIVNPEHLHAELNVYEKDILKIREGQQVEIRVPQNPDSIYLGEIFLVGKELDQDNRSVNVHAHIPENKNWKVGMYVEGRILTLFKEVYVVPSNALIRQENGSFIFIVDKRENKNLFLKKIQVETGAEQSGMVEISLPGTLPENMEVATRGVYYLDSQ